MLGRGLKTKTEARHIIRSAGQTLRRKKLALLLLALVALVFVFPSSADGTNSDNTQPAVVTQSQETPRPKPTVNAKQARNNMRTVRYYKGQTRKWAHLRSTHARGAHSKTKWSTSPKYNRRRAAKWKKKAKKQRIAYKKHVNSTAPCVRNGIPRSICAALKQAAPMARVPQSWVNDPHLAYIMRRESGFSCNAQNPTSTAYGLFQFLDSTWAGTGVRKSANCVMQAKAGLIYIKRRYHSPTGAYNWWRTHHWY